jgi:hypothetical protein
MMMMMMMIIIIIIIIIVSVRARYLFSKVPKSVQVPTQPAVQ